MYLETTIFGFTIDPMANRPLVILKDVNDNSIPIWLGNGEILSIAAELMQSDTTARSGRKDLMTLLLAHTGTEIGSIVIEGGDDGITASVKFTRNGEELRCEVRPCDAIILALKYRMPIMVAETVLESASVLELSDEPIRGNDARRYAEFLENLDPATLGKYPM